MPAFIAMLRGVNAAGNRIKMEHLRASCRGLGLEKVQTYVQSGNIVFTTATKSPDVLSNRISEMIQRDFGFRVPVIMRTSKEMDAVISTNPFLKERNVDPSKLHVTFLSEIPQKSSLKNLETLPTGSDRFQAGAREVYLYCPDGYGRTKLSNAAIEKAISGTATTRNWRTANALFDMASKLS